MTGLDDETEVWRERAGVTGACGLLIRVRRRHVVGELSRALEHLALVVGTVSVLNLLGHRPRLIRGVRNTDEGTPGNTVERVACRAHFTVNLVSATNA